MKQRDCLSCAWNYFSHKIMRQAREERVYHHNHQRELRMIIHSTVNLPVTSKRGEAVKQTRMFEGTEMMRGSTEDKHVFNSDFE
jgi:hypothetical protein